MSKIFTVKKRLAFVLLFVPFLSIGQSISYLENTVLFATPAARIQEKFLTTTTGNFDVRLTNGKLFNPILQFYNYNKLAIRNFQFGIGNNAYIGRFVKSGNMKFDANYSFRLSENLNLSLGLGANINQFGLFHVASSTNPSNFVSNRFVGWNTGFMLQGKKWKTGLSINNFNQPRYSIFDDTIKLKSSVGFYFDYQFQINKNWLITPQINFGGQHQLHNLLGLTAYYKKLQFGASLLGNGFCFFAGYTFNERFMMAVVSKFNEPFNMGGKLNSSTMMNFTFQLPKKKKESGVKL
jgi:hypothetical protein